ncbi:hypothetical protein [Kribbella sp.]|uniref:hypothetical protein n=1 Tax=Kribbella sp. TaxID=1871183 RepID=UPI002D6C71D7|nr:hypothetical protein [Kribbella sp.]HZX02983.1 hypothetical protein [Kribbella sp.]
MFDIDPRDAKLTVKFGREVTGEQVIAAVRVLAEEAGDEFHEVKGFDDGWRHGVGRGSRHPERPAVVIADRGTPYLEPDASYQQVVIVSHPVPGPIPTFSPGHDANIETVVQSLQEYGADLGDRCRLLADEADLARGPVVSAIVLDEAAAKQTVDLGRLTSGLDILDAVGKASESERANGARPFEYREGLRCQAGQTGPAEHQNLVVIPDTGYDFIEPGGLYGKVVVANHQLPQHTVPIESTPEQKAAAVGNFATALRDNVRQQHAASVGLDRGPLRVTGEGARIDPAGRTGARGETPPGRAGLRSEARQARNPNTR